MAVAMVATLVTAGIAPAIALTVNAPAAAPAALAIPFVPGAPVAASISGEIEFLTLDSATDPWSGGTIVVGGQIVILPKNLLLDLPANRMTLTQLFAQAPAACQNGLNGTGESGLAKADTCNLSGAGGIATIAANKTSNGNVIAGDVLIEKGVESVTGVVTYISYTDGYVRLAGEPGSATTGVMVRLNDPTSRHTVQTGAGCAGGPNCSADPRFTLDADNYTAVFGSGYPVCIPSTVSRTFVDVLGLGTTTAQAALDGSGDVLCPLANRSNPVNDSRLFAPIVLGDPLTAEGNFETINGVHFLSAHTLMVDLGLTTKAEAGQPDYIFIDEAFIDAPGFQNQRTRALFIGFSTLAPADILLWSLHYDPATNTKHEFPLGSTAGCDAAAGAGTCSGQGIIAAGNDIFRIRYDVDYGVGATSRLDPCAHLRSDPRMGTGICPGWPAGGDTINGPAKFNTDFTDMFGILSPIPHEIQFRTGKKFADLQLATPLLITLDINGNDATNGQYLMPFGIGLGGIDIPNFFEININEVSTPFSFSGIPWNLDRRLSPGGCPTGTCEATSQPLDPFPFEGVAMDPRLQAPPTGVFLGLPQGPYADPNFTNTTLTRAANRILSYVSGTAFAPPFTPDGFNFDGDNTLLAWPPVDPAHIAIGVTPPLVLGAPAAPLPAITSFVPVIGPVGTSVTITGTGFTGATSVKFNGTAALFLADSDTTITTEVPTGATTGKLTVTTAGGTGTSATDFTVTAPTATTITSFTPASGPVGTSVTISGTNFTGATDVSFNGTAATFTVDSDTSISTSVPAGATTGTISVTTTAGGTATSATDFTVTAPTATTITSFTPASGPVGTSVTISGTNFTGATDVSFNGTAATFTVDSDTSISTSVPAGATTGTISVTTTAGGTATSATSFTVTVPAPTITSFTPASGPVGTSVTISGTNFTGATSVKFNSTAATFTVGSDTSISTSLPAGATTGTISVTTGSGSATSATSFTVTTVIPVVDHAAPISVFSAALGSLTVTGSDPNVPALLPLTFSVTQSGAPALLNLTVTPLTSTSATVTFTAPTLPLGQVLPSVINLNITATNTAGSVSLTEFTTVTIKPLPDVVTITNAEYRIRQQRLTLTATSSVNSPNVVLTLQPYITTAGATFTPPNGTLTNAGGGNYTLNLLNVPQPGAATLLIVKSNLNGTSPGRVLDRVRN
jgi:hypothetical protein